MRVRIEQRDEYSLPCKIADLSSTDGLTPWMRRWLDHDADEIHRALSAEWGRMGGRMGRRSASQRRWLLRKKGDIPKYKRCLGNLGIPAVSAWFVASGPSSRAKTIL
jgi:hypothetical protein